MTLATEFRYFEKHMPGSKKYTTRIKELREAAGMTQKDLANAAEVGLSTVREIEQGKSGGTVATLGKLAAALGVSESQLVVPPESSVPASPKIGRPRKRQTDDAKTPIFIVGVVAAGDGSFEELDGSETLDVAEMFADCVAYQVCGDSMRDAHIADGDYVIVRRQPVAQPGETVVAWIEGDGAVVKRLGPGGYLLSASTDKTRTPIKMKDGDRILGVLVGVVRRC